MGKRFIGILVMAVGAYMGYRGFRAVDASGLVRGGIIVTVGLIIYASSSSPRRGR